jgi:hypothetical protein
LTPPFIGAGLRAQGDFSAQPRESRRGTVMTIKFELVDLGDAMVETRQLPILPLFFDSISGVGLLPL